MSALGCAILPVCNAFIILLVITAIYAIFGTHYFRAEAPMYFANFGASSFTMFQVCKDIYAAGMQRYTRCRSLPPLSPSIVHLSLSSLFSLSVKKGGPGLELWASGSCVRVRK